VTLDPADLEACYAHAWQGLYAATLAGQEIANPAGWLMLVTFRRAIEEHRARRRLGDEPLGGEAGGERQPLHERAAVREPDLAAELDDRLQLRRFFEGLRARLSAREREAAVLCYLQGLTRAQAAARMGVSESRMRKLMEGPGAGRPGVAGKVSALVGTIRDGDWCEEQDSLMRGLAFGMLDPAGERYRLAVMHRDSCPACRAYVLSVRRLAVALPPVVLPYALGAGALGIGAAAARVGAGPPAGGVAAASGAGASAGGAAAGGGWVAVGGPLGAKLAVGCLLAVGVGAGCVALGGGPVHPRRAPLAAGSTARDRSGSAPTAGAGSGRAAQVAARGALARAASGPRASAQAAGGSPARAGVRREFTPEQPAEAGGTRPARHAPRPAVAAAVGAPEPAAGARATPAGEAQVRREFSPG
jgi:DNA-directed RNA polymerase specialized sigma24 family protein